jgi:hypothetical protein
MVAHAGRSHIGVRVDLRVEMALALHPWVERRAAGTLSPIARR